MGGIWLCWWCWWGGGGTSAACRVLQSPAGVCSPLLYEANEKIPGYLYGSRA